MEEKEIAVAQQSALPFLPVTTTEEKALFGKLIAEGLMKHSGKRAWHFDIMAERWTKEYVNGETVFPERVS